MFGRFGERLLRASEGSAPARFGYRLGLMARHPGMAARRPGDSARYLLRSRELDNFTYELRNEPELAPLVAGALGESEEEAGAYLRELRNDSELMDELGAALRLDPRRDDVARLGKRRALYAAVRLGRPRVVIEAGVADGLASAVLLRALERNETEGSPGRLIAVDIDPSSGWLVSGARSRGRFELRIGDVLKVLPAALDGDRIDLFIHDTSKTPEQERRELELAIEHGAERLVLYSDDDSITGMLRAVCEEHGGRSRFLRETPGRHFWRGNLLGFCVIERGPGAPTSR